MAHVRGMGRCGHAPSLLAIRDDRDRTPIEAQLLMVQRMQRSALSRRAQLVSMSEVVNTYARSPQHSFASADPRPTWRHRLRAMSTDQVLRIPFESKGFDGIVTVDTV